MVGEAYILNKDVYDLTNYKGNCPDSAESRIYNLIAGRIYQAWEISKGAIKRGFSITNKILFWEK